MKRNKFILVDNKRAKMFSFNICGVVLNCVNLSGERVNRPSNASDKTRRLLRIQNGGFWLLK